MRKTVTKFVCQNCGYESPKWLGRCPDCDQWASLVEETTTARTERGARDAATSYHPPMAITSVRSGADKRTGTQIQEFDRVLGGGVVEGSLVLIGGDPGIGKSTLLTQVAQNLSRDSGKTLYVSGEESVQQIKMRADRLGPVNDDLLLATETDILAVQHYVDSLKPAFVIVDSIQVMYHPEFVSAPGTVSQVRNCTALLARMAKTSGVPVFIVGHVTKEGALAGPRVLEHMVDTVLYFEGDRHQTYRILRAVKNRFGSTDELGIFEMREEGLIEVPNPSEVFLSERPQHGAGSVVTSTIEGARPILVEVQALVAPSHFAGPRRMATGVDHNRTLMILAVLEKRVGLNLANQDVYVNVAGGMRVAEPAVDLAIAVAVASNFKEMAVDPTTVLLGEIGLAGEIRAVGQTEKRLREAARLGFTKAIVPTRSAGKVAKSTGLKPIGVDTLRDAIWQTLEDSGQ
ncbi:MAG: DNA repair protein RadA [Armatimonadota bacterium]|nr:DNA repair protein RadA [Armatimonadota bacterium]